MSKRYKLHFNKQYKVLSIIDTQQPGTVCATMSADENSYEAARAHLQKHCDELNWREANNANGGFDSMYTDPEANR